MNSKKQLPRRRAVPAIVAIILASCSSPSSGPSKNPTVTTPAPRGIVLLTVSGWWDPQSKTDAIHGEVLPGAVRLADAMTPSPQVRLAVCAMLSGRSPAEIGVRDDVTTPLPESVDLVPKTLAARGWRTAAFVADPRVGIGSGLERGFEVFDPPKEILFGSYRRLPRVRSAVEIVSDFSTWLATIPPDASFFAWIQISRPVAGAAAGIESADLENALERFSKIAAESSRLKAASIAIVGTSGKMDSDDGERSGYVLSSEVLRVPAILRPPGSQRPFGLTEIAAWIAHEAGAETGSEAAAGGARIAWTWRGRNEFGWPAEMAAQSGSALCVRSAPGAEDRCTPWNDGTPVLDADKSACVAALNAQPNSWADAPAVSAIPKELDRRLTELGERARPGAAAASRAVPRATRTRLVPGIMRARRLEDAKSAMDADAEYQKAAAADPGNFGVLIEAGEILALSGQAKRARTRLERALQMAPSNPEAWHWLGHVSYLDKHLDRADAEWQAADALRPGNADVLYDLACSRSIMGRLAESDAYLRRAWAAGFREMNKIQVDGDLRNLRADPAFLKFMREVVH